MEDSRIVSCHLNFFLFFFKFREIFSQVSSLLNSLYEMTIFFLGTKGRTAAWPGIICRYEHHYWNGFRGLCATWLTVTWLAVTWLHCDTTHCDVTNCCVVMITSTGMIAEVCVWHDSLWRGSLGRDFTVTRLTVTWLIVVSLWTLLPAWFLRSVCDMPDCGVVRCDMTSLSRVSLLCRYKHQYRHGFRGLCVTWLTGTWLAVTWLVRHVSLW